MIRYTTRFLFVALFLSLTTAACLAQDADGSPGGDAGMGRAFGRGNGVRGTVTASAPDSFTIRTDEGDTYRVLYSVNTRLMKDRQPIEASGIHVGDMLMAGGIVDAKAKTVGAVFLFDIDAAQVRDARAAFGKTWTAGKVTAIQDLRITIQRANDKQVQVVSVDENTSFRKHREDVTLSDIKVGDFITAQGGLHGDTFLAASLHVMTPGSGPGSGRQGGPDQPPQNNSSPGTKNGPQQ